MYGPTLGLCCLEPPSPPPTGLRSSSSLLGQEVLAGADSAKASPDWGDGFVFSHIWVFFSRHSVKPYSSHVLSRSSGFEREAEPDLGLWGKKEEAKEMMSGSAQAPLPGDTGSVK